MKITTTGKSLKELLEIYGTGSNGFYSQEWYKTESFFIEKPPANMWDFDFGTNLTDKTYPEQVSFLKKGFEVMHLAVLAEAILSHYKNTGVRLLENKYSRTNVFTSDGNRVGVGDFDVKGLLVSNWYDGHRHDHLGVSAARKLSLNAKDIVTAEYLTLEARVAELESGMKKIKKILII